MPVSTAVVCGFAAGSAAVNAAAAVSAPAAAASGTQPRVVATPAVWPAATAACVVYPAAIAADAPSRAACCASADAPDGRRATASLPAISELRAASDATARASFAQLPGRPPPAPAGGGDALTADAGGGDAVPVVAVGRVGEPKLPPRLVDWPPVTIDAMPAATSASPNIGFAESKFVPNALPGPQPGDAPPVPFEPVEPVEPPAPPAYGVPQLGVDASPPAPLPPALVPDDEPADGSVKRNG